MGPVQNRVRFPLTLPQSDTARMLMSGVSLHHTHQHIRVIFSSPFQVMSSAVLNGGLIMADHLVNLKVAESSGSKHSKCLSPENTLKDYCQAEGWEGIAVGMMTAASMKSLRLSRASLQGVDLVVLATTGLANLRRAGDRAEYRTMGEQTVDIGTINIQLLTSAMLTSAAMAEVLMMITEAKAAVLQELGLRSPVSLGIATGTGTDSVAVGSLPGGRCIRYCGKHVIFGEILAQLVMDAIRQSVTRR